MIHRPWLVACPSVAERSGGEGKSCERRRVIDGKAKKGKNDKREKE
jgi:hypothetical protein